MKEGAGFEILRRKGQRRPFQDFKIVHFHAKICHFGGIFAKVFMLRVYVEKTPFKFAPRRQSCTNF